MHTNKNLTPEASKFRRHVRMALAGRDWNVRGLAARIGKSRSATSRAINRGEFPAVQKLIMKALSK